MPEPKIHDERYIPGSRIARAADRVAEALGKDYPGSYTPSKRDRLCYIRDRRGVASLVVWLPTLLFLFLRQAPGALLVSLCWLFLFAFIHSQS